MNDNKVTMKIMQTIVAMVVLIATVFGVHAGISSNYTTNAVFQEFKDGTIGAVYQRLTRLEDKVDSILTNLENRDASPRR